MSIQQATSMCKYYNQGYCRLYPEKSCAGEKCGVWGVYQDCFNLQTKNDIATDKILFLLRLIVHSGNTRIYIKSNIAVFEIEDCKELYRIAVFDRIPEIKSKFFDIDTYEGEIPADFHFDFSAYFKKLGI